MTAYQAALDDLASRQAERAARADAELQHLKQAVIVPLRQAGIARVEIRFDGYGNSGAIEEISGSSTSIVIAAGGSTVERIANLSINSAKSRVVKRSMMTTAAPTLNANSVL